ncbi:GNAT family N-acetyltransferase [Halobellus marinus]|jgi:ribosomal protein S18 acetylase RimI-like enzyme|uniref:GNAT family N-acetyltransferase n=1 Tax=Halobellus TaxID=1073986 RepID=UPI0028AF4392|nr:GNAT family N-acetyltransferase [Halobellus sp. DFY28]
MGESGETADRDQSPDADAAASSEQVTIGRPDVGVVDALVDLWVSLAGDQRAHDSHILPTENRSLVRETLARQVVADGVRIAQSGDEVVGFVSFDLERGSFEQDATRGVVRNVYVRPEYRGRGVGTDLMDAAEDTLRAAGASVVSLEAMAGNDRARAFYRDRGYAPHRIQFEKRVRSGDEMDDESGETSSDPSAENDTHSKED